MTELKTFGELSIQDRFYVKCKNNGNTFVLVPQNLKKSQFTRDFIEVQDDDGNTTDLPIDETRYEDESYIYTTSGKEYNKWQIPEWEKQIKEKEQKISIWQSEIEELQEHINIANK